LKSLYFEYYLIIALKTPFASTPGCEKKFLSSADKKELITFFGIAYKEQKFFFLLKNQQLNHHFLNTLCLKLEVYNFLKIYNLVYYLKKSIKLQNKK
jgi:hypothetical protein